MSAAGTILTEGKPSVRTLNERYEGAKRLHLLAKRAPKARRLRLLKLAFLGRMLARAQRDNERDQKTQRTIGDQLDKKRHKLIFNQKHTTAVDDQT
jgi:hypothetical protein